MARNRISIAETIGRHLQHKFARYYGAPINSIVDVTGSLTIDALESLWEAKFGSKGRVPIEAIEDGNTPFDSLFDDVASAEFFVRAFRRLVNAGRLRFDEEFETGDVIWRL